MPSLPHPPRRVQAGCGRRIAVVLLATLVAGCQSGTTADSAAVSARAAAGIPDCSAWASTSSAKAAEASGEAARVGRTLPALTLSCLGGDRLVSTSAVLTGTPHVVTMWASWCGPCRAEAPMMAALARSGRVDVIGIDYGEHTATDGVDFARAAGWTFPQLQDPDQSTRTAWGLTGMPVTLVVDADGVVVVRRDGAWNSADDLRRAVDAALGR